MNLIVEDKYLGMSEVLGEIFPEAKYQQCTIHFYSNVFFVSPRSKIKLVTKILKASLPKRTRQQLGRRSKQ